MRLLTKSFHIKRQAALILILLLLSTYGHMFVVPYPYQNTYFNYLCSGLILLTLLGASFLMRQKTLKWTTIDTIICLYYFYILANSLVIGIEPTEHWKSTLLFSAFFIIKFIRDYIDTDMFFRSLLLVTLFYIVQLAYIEWQIPSLNYNKFGAFQNQTSLALYLSLVFPFNVYVLRKTVLKYLFILVVCPIILYYSRTAFLGLCVSISLTYFDKKYDKSTLILSIVSLGIILALINIQSIFGRFLIWKIGIYSLSFQDLVLGRGSGFVFNHFLSLQAAYFSVERPLSEQLIAGQVHTVLNEFLRIFIENGIVGLSLFVYGLIMIHGKIQALLKYRKAYVMFFCTFVLISFSSYPLSSMTICMLLVILISTCYQYEVKQVKQYKLLTLKMCLLILTSTLLIHVTCIQVALGKWSRLMKSRYNKYNEIAFIEKANILLETLDSFPIILNEYSRVLFSMGMFREALEKSLESDSQMTVLSTNLMTALLYEKIGDDERAETYYLRSIQMAPKVLSSKLLLFNFYRESGDVQQSLEMAKAIRDYPVKVKSSESEQIKLYISDYLSNTLKNEKLL